MKKVIALCVVASVSFSSIYSESFVKEKAKKTKKVSLSRCQEECIAPLSRLMEQSYHAASYGNELVALGDSIVRQGHEFTAQALSMQNDALDATADLLNEERSGGCFASMTLEDLERYCKQLEKMASDLAREQEKIEFQVRRLEKIVPSQQAKQNSLK